MLFLISFVRNVPYKKTLVKWKGLRALTKLFVFTSILIRHENIKNMVLLFRDENIIFNILHGASSDVD